MRKFLNKLSTLPEDVPPKYYRFYFVGGYTFFAALVFHIVFIFIFFLISVKPLALLNIGSTLLWIFILWSHLIGKKMTSVSLATFEINFHAAMCVVFIGLNTGFQYYILSLPLFIFFTPWLSNNVKIALTFLVCCIFAGLHFLYANAVPVHVLNPFLVNILHYGNILSIFFILALASYYYVTAATNAEAALEKEKAKSDEMAALLKKMFGRYLSTEVMNSLIEDPSTLELGGEKRRVTIMMTDLRGFTALSERLEPEQVVQMLNAYFEVMVEVILKHNGTINEIIGDALLVIFGAPQEMPDRTERAIACSIEMQNAMSKVNRDNSAQGLPELEMGIGLNEAEVIVGNIGSSKRSKYAVVGSGVNVTSRIESYTFGGQILVSESVRQKAGEVLRIDGQRDVLPKGVETSLRIYEVGGIAGPYNIALERRDPAPVVLARQVPLRCVVLEGKEVGELGLEGFVVELSSNSAEVLFSAPVEIFSNLKMNLAGVDEKLSAKDFYGKAIQLPKANTETYSVRFTSVPPEVDAYFQALRLHAAKPGGV
ncbi:MAG: adenylate/guanylate cyclase domain-containing protein [Deltaproteobacteria bacterium]